MRVLLVDDDPAGRQALAWFLKRQQHEVDECADGAAALRLYVQGEYPLVLADVQMPGMSGVDLAAAIKKMPQGWRTDVVLVTGHADLQSAVSALRAGVYDYLEKPVNIEALACAIERVAEHQALVRENKLLTERFQSEVEAATQATRCELARMQKLVADSVVGTTGVFSACMQRIAQQAGRLHADRSIPVLIEGETGTGKEVVAKMVHYGVAVDNATPFVDINCAAIAPSLFESELFGYEAGSFTGSSSKGARGKFDMACGGTLFLDEIGEIPLELQGKLLRVLQEKEFYRVGGLKKIKTDVRVICATNVPLEERVAQGSFRKDLYFRLKVAHITIPPLRERKEAILPIATMFLNKFSQQKRKQIDGISSEAARLLEAHAWPGSVRELQNVIEYAVFACDERQVKPEHVGGLLPAPCGVGGSQRTGERALVLPFPEAGCPLKRFTEEVILQVLAAHDQNQTAAAEYLGISRRALTYRLEEIRNRNNK